MSASVKSPHFLLRRLHSLLGLLPAGGFLMFHLWENSQTRLGGAHYNEHVVKFIKGMNYLLLLEIFTIALPLIFHALYGLVVLWDSKSNVTRYRYARNWGWWLQRISGLGLIFFLALHVGGTRIYSIFHPEIAADLFAHMQRLLSSPLVFGLYLLGIVLAVFHLSNGLWTMGITWGLTTTPRSQTISRAITAGVGILLLGLGLHGLLGFFIAKGVDPSIAPWAAL